MDAAPAVFTEQTYDGAAVALITNRAGVAVGTLDRHFPQQASAGYHLTQGADPDEPAWEAFGRMWRALLGFAT